MSLFLETRDFIQSQKLIKTGDSVIVGVSGGPDSVALLHLLYNLRHDLGITLSIAHYNHNLRPGAKLDQQFVKKLAEKLKLFYYTETWKNPPNKNSKGSLEELARKERLNFFGRLVKKNPNTKIALAHTQDDLAETVLMRILRGAGLQGMRSILPQTTLNNLTVIRPLLEISKKKILTYLKKNSLSFCQDPMNNDLDFFRNKIRLRLLPLLKKEYSSNIHELLSHLSQTVTIDYDYLRGESQKKFRQLVHSLTSQKIEIDLKKFQHHHLAIQRMLIRLAIEHLRGNTNKFTSRHIEQIQKFAHNNPSHKKTLALPKRICCQRTEKRLIFLTTHDNFKGL